MSKVLLINGSLHEHGCTDTALKEIMDTLHSLEVDTELVWIGISRSPGASPVIPATPRRMGSVSFTIW